MVRARTVNASPNCLKLKPLGGLAIVTLIFGTLFLVISTFTPGWSTCHVKGWDDGGHTSNWALNSNIGLLYAQHSQPFNTSSHSIENIPDCEAQGFSASDCSFKQRRAASFAFMFLSVISNIIGLITTCLYFIKKKLKVYI